MSKINKISSDNFIFNWILKNKLAVGTSPEKKEDMILLKKYQIRNILSLCSEKEAKWHSNLESNFECKRIVLPDSNKNKLPTETQIKKAFNALKNFFYKDITYVHCFASIERSPLLCIVLVMEIYNLSLEESLDYVKRMHHLTNPRNNQLFFIKNLNFNNV
jgi:protein-tyrosine phosphatase